METNVWTYRDHAKLGYDPTNGKNLSGYGVEAIDGSIGKIDSAITDETQSYVVVDTGPWIFGKKVMLPAGVVERIDENEEKVWVNRTKDQIKNSPEYGDEFRGDAEYHSQLGSYYGLGGLGYRDWDDYS